MVHSRKMDEEFIAKLSLISSVISLIICGYITYAACESSKQCGQFVGALKARVSYFLNLKSLNSFLIQIED